MEIMTKNGWRQLSPAECTAAMPAMAYNGIPAPYAGLFPSKEVCAFINDQQEKMKYFDNGVRLVYGRPDKIVEVDNATPIHPIPNPPAGF